MSAHRAVLLVLLVVGGSLAAAAPTSAMVDSTEQSDAVESGDAAATDTADAPATDARFAAAQSNDSAAQNDSENSSLGGDISSFMQSSAAEIDGAVETGMWSAEFNATSDRSRQQRLVERRTDELRTELNDLQERREALVAERDAGNVSDAAYKARIGQLLGRINALKSAINATEPRARQVDTNVDALQMLESDAQNLTGPEIAAVARNTTGVGNGNGPPDGVGSGSDDAGGPPEDVGNASGPLEDAGNGSGADVGPPNDVGNGTANGNGTAGVAADTNGTEVGNSTEIGNGTGNGNATDNRATGLETGSNATSSGASAGSDSHGPAVGLNLSAESLGMEPVSDAMRIRTTTVLRTLPFA